MSTKIKAKDLNEPGYIYRLGKSEKNVGGMIFTYYEINFYNFNRIYLHRGERTCPSSDQEELFSLVWQSDSGKIPYAVRVEMQYSKNISMALEILSKVDHRINGFHFNTSFLSVLRFLRKRYGARCYSYDAALGTYIPNKYIRAQKAAEFIKAIDLVAVK